MQDKKTNCPDCETLYFDFGSMDLAGCKPVLLQIRLPNPFGTGTVLITQKAVPKFKGIDFKKFGELNFYDKGLWACYTKTLKQSDSSAFTNLSFEAMPDNGTLMTMEVD